MKKLVTNIGIISKKCNELNPKYFLFKKIYTISSLYIDKKTFEVIKKCNEFIGLVVNKQ